MGRLPHLGGTGCRDRAALGVKLQAGILPGQFQVAQQRTGIGFYVSGGVLEVQPHVVTILADTAIRAKDMDEAAAQAGGRCLEGTADKTISEIDLGDNLVLIMGAEGKGLRPLTQEKCDLLVKIPIAGKMESLNVSNAAAVVLYELSKI